MKIDTDSIIFSSYMRFYKNSNLLIRCFYAVKGSCHEKETFRLCAMARIKSQSDGNLATLPEKMFLRGSWQEHHGINTSIQIIQV